MLRINLLNPQIECRISCPYPSNMPMDPGPRSRATMRMAAGALELMDANEQDPGIPWDPVTAAGCWFNQQKMASPELEIGCEATKKIGWTNDHFVKFSPKNSGFKFLSLSRKKWVIRSCDNDV